MKLTKVRVQNYRSVEDSEEFEIGDLTCLVGKNEAGKTALLSAMRGLHPWPWADSLKSFRESFSRHLATSRGRQWAWR